MSDVLTARQLAEYLQISERTVYRLLARNELPAVRVGGQWRFQKSAVGAWLEARARGSLPASAGRHDARPGAGGAMLAATLTAENVVLDLPVAPPAEMVKRFVAQVQFPEPVDREPLIRGILEREAICSTAMPEGVAILHPRRGRPRHLRRHDLWALGRLRRPADFAALDGQLIDLLLLLLACDDRRHLVLLAKLSRLCRDRSFLTAVRKAATPTAVLSLVAETERRLFGRTAAHGNQARSGNAPHHP